MSNEFLGLKEAISRIKEINSAGTVLTLDQLRQFVANASAAHIDLNAHGVNSVVLL